MRAWLCIALVCGLTFAAPAAAQDKARPTTAAQIDYQGFRGLAGEVEAYRAGRLVSLADFQSMSREPNTIILDAYNANPSSMQAAINNMAAMNATHKVLILGDMFELEEEADKEHRAIGQLLKKLAFDKVYLCGTLMKSAKEEYPQAELYEKKEALADALRQQPINDATILVKASRGIGLETIVDYL